MTGGNIFHDGCDIDSGVAGGIFSMTVLLLLCIDVLQGSAEFWRVGGKGGGFRGVLGDLTNRYQFGVYFAGAPDSVSRPGLFPPCLCTISAVFCAAGKFLFTRKKCFFLLLVVHSSSGCLSIFKRYKRKLQQQSSQQQPQILLGARRIFSMTVLLCIDVLGKGVRSSGVLAERGTVCLPWYRPRQCMRGRRESNANVNVQTGE